MKNKGSSIFVVVLIIVVLVLSCYIVYDKIINNSQSDDSVTEPIDQTKELSSTSVTDFYFDSVAIVNQGSVYINVYGSTSELDSLFGEGTFQTLIATRQKYKEYDFENFEYNSNDNSNFTGIKLNTSNVEKVYSYAYGQAVSSNYGLILLNQDKTLSIISLYSLINGKTDVKAISGLYDIEGIITENNGGMVTYAVKQNGDKINLNDYIPNNYNEF